jgi:Ca2+-binding EF-hand superfamily protein
LKKDGKKEDSGPPVVKLEEDEIAQCTKVFNEFDPEGYDEITQDHLRLALAKIGIQF